MFLEDSLLWISVPFFGAVRLPGRKQAILSGEEMQSVSRDGEVDRLTNFHSTIICLQNRTNGRLTGQGVRGRRDDYTFEQIMGDVLSTANRVSTFFANRFCSTILYTISDKVLGH